MDCFLHIGTGKTGTSSIQSMLFQNRRALQKRGYLYPRSPGKGRHEGLGWYAHADSRTVSRPGWKRSGWKNPAEFRADFEQRLEKELHTCNPRTVVFSDEGLQALPNERKKFLFDFLKQSFEKITVIVYLRRQDDHLISAYQQRVKTGHTITLETFIQRHLAHNPDGRGTPGSDADPPVHDYYQLLCSWSDLFGRQNIVPRLFEKDAWAQNSLLHDFLEVIGISDPSGFKFPPPSNQSLDAERVEFLRAFNRTLPARPDEATDKMRIQLRQILMKQSGPEVLSLPEEMLDEVMLHWAESNRKVATEFFGFQDGVLFHAPRKSTPQREQAELDVDTCMRIFHDVMKAGMENGDFVFRTPGIAGKAERFKKAAHRLLLSARNRFKKN